jgi:hypothetical protein
MSNYATSTEMTQMFERLRLQLRFRELKTKLGDDQALRVVEDALRLEFISDRVTSLPDTDQTGVKNSPVVIQCSHHSRAKVDRV